MSLDRTKFRLGSGNLYLFEGSTPAYVLAGYVTGITLTLTSTRATLTGGQTGTSPVDKVVTGVEAALTGEFEQIMLESWMRSMRGNTLLGIDDITPTKRRLEIVAAAGQSMLALAQKVKFAPLVGGAETSNLEEILVMPLAIAGANAIKAQYDWQNKTTISFTFDGLVDSDTRDRIIYFGDDTVIAATPKKVL